MNHRIIIKKSYNFILENKIILLLVLSYLIFRLFNLYSLPLFNDESIYLDWGLRQINVPGNLYYSLYDGKQPFLIWIFGISQNIFNDPLFAGRIISIACGLFSLVGIYLLTTKILNKNSAILASVIFIISPIFIFYDRQALMESSLVAVGIWSYYFLFKLLETNDKISALLLGLVLGLGFFIKSSALIFIFSSLLVYLLINLKNKKFWSNLNLFGIILLTLILVNTLLFINSDFWNSLSKNSRYTLSLLELINFPLNIWLSNFLINFKILFLNFGIILLIFSIFGIISSLIFKKKEIKYLSCWIIICLLIQIFVSKNSNSRYLVSFIPLLIIPAVYFFEIFKNRYRNAANILIVFSLLLLLIQSLYLLYNPSEFIKKYSMIASKDELSYIYGSTSGYGINELNNYIRSESTAEKLLVGIAVNTGNPESALFAYYPNNKNVVIAYLDKRLMGDIEKYDCLDLGLKTVFVSRNDEQAGLEKFFIKHKEIKKIDNNFIGIYKLKNDCSKDRTLILRRQFLL